jgi:DNA-directed RNA polymerase subunit K/omega
VLSVGIYALELSVGAYALELSVRAYALELSVGAYALELSVGAYALELSVGAYALELSVGPQSPTGPAGRPSSPAQGFLKEAKGRYARAKHCSQACGADTSRHGLQLTSTCIVRAQ